jgi:PKD repeat protein
MKSVFTVIFCFLVSHIYSQSCTIQINPGGTQCGGTKVELSISNPNPQTTYSWDFNNDRQEDAQGAKVTYTLPKRAGTSNFNVTATVSINNNQCGSQVINVRDVPSAELGVPNSLEGVKMENQVIRVCNTTVSSFELQLINRSTTTATNQSYTIDWGGGNVVNLGANDFSGIIKNNYTSIGYRDILFTVKGSNGCNNTEQFRYFRGSNPEFESGSKGSTINLCAPVTLNFPLTNTENNPPGTEYIVSVNGQPKLNFLQETVPSSFSLVFDETSCGKTTSTNKSKNAYDVEVKAINPCGLTRYTVEPIEVSATPIPDFSIQSLQNCPGQLFTLQNTTANIFEVKSGGSTNPSTCEKDLLADWEISPGQQNVDWRNEGSSLFSVQKLNVTFLKAGDYTVTMFIKSAACGVKMIKKTISIQPAPTADANASFKTKNQCTGEEVTFNNFSTGNGLSYTWTVTGPAGGHTFINNTNANAKNPSLRFDKAGSYNVKLESKNVCSKATWDTTIVLNSAPQVSFEKIPDQCERAELNFSPSQVKIESTLPITSEWTFNGANPAGSTDKNPQKIIYNLPGTYFITLKANNTCGDGTFRDTFLVQSPVALSLPKDTTLCRNTGTLALKAFPTGGKWSGNKAVQENGLLKPADLPTGETTLTYNFGTGVCKAEGKIKIILIDPPTVDAGNDRVLCANGNQLQLMATPSGGTWSSPTGKISTEGVFNPVDNPVGTYRARYIFRDAKGCTNRDSIMVKVVAPTKVTAQNATYCNAPGLVNLPPATPSGGVWRGDKVVNSNQFDPIAAGGPGTYSLFYVLIDGNGCKDSAIAKISVVDAIVIQAGRDTQICTGKGMLNLNLGASPNNGRWSEAKLGDIPQGQVDLAKLSVGTYTFSYQIGTGNCLVKDEKKIEILALPTIKLDNNSTQVCISTDTLALKAEPGSGTWSSTRGKLLGNNFLPKQSGTGTYDLVYNFINTQGCSQQSSIKIAVNPLPNIQVNDTSYCNVTVGVNLPKALPIGGTWSGNGVTGNQFFPQKAGGTGSYPVIYEVKDRNDCKNTDTITITVNDPNKIEAGNDLEVCISLNQLNLNDGTSPLNGRWREDKIGPVANGVFNPSAVTAGTYTFTYEIGAGSCLVSDQKKVTVLGLPQINLKDNPSAICISRDTLSLKASPSGGTWQSTTGIIEQGTFRALKSGAKNHNLSYSYTDGKGCSNRVAFDILVNPLPIVSSIDTSYCNTSGEVKLPEATPVGGAWSGLGVKNNRFSPQQAGGVGNYKLVYTYADNKQCSNSDTVNINVADPQKVEAGQDEQVCISEKTLDLNKAVTPTGGRWNEERLGNIATGVFMPSIQKAGIYTFTYTVGAGNCAVSDQKKIEVLSLPSLDLKNNPTGVCVNVDSVVLNSTPLGGTWSSRNGIIKKQSFFPKSSGAGNYFLRYQFSDATGCSGIDSIPFVVNGLPKIQTQDTTYCNTPGTVTLPITQPAGGNWKGKGVKNNQFDPQTAGGLGEYPVVYTYKDAQGCIDSARIKIAVTAPPVVDAGANDTFCIDESPVTLRNFFPQTGGTWEGPGIVNKSTGQIDLYLAKGGLHRYQYSVGVGNCKVSDAIELSIIDLTKVNAGLLQSVCFAEKELQLSGANPVGGIWTGTGVIDSIKGTFAPTLVGEGTFSLQYKLTDKASGCTASAKKEVTVYPMPESSFRLPVEACINGPVKFENTSRSTFQPEWIFGSLGRSQEVSPQFTFKDTGAVQILLTTINEFGCKDDTSANIYIFEPPTPAFIMDKNRGCSVLPVGFTNQSKGYRTRFEWDFGNGQNSMSTSPDTVFYPQGRNDTTYIITLSAINACATRTYIDSIKVFPIPVVDFGIPIDTNCTPVKVIFANNSYGKPENYLWNLGNGKSWTGAIPPLQVYATDTIPTTYQISLIASNFCGRDTAIRDLVVNPIDVESFFNVPNPVGCQPYAVQFTNYATPGAFVEWIFGDGNTSSLPNPQYTFQKPGIYEVVQRASNGCGYDSSTVKITVLPAPIVEFQHTNPVCPKQPVNFVNLSKEVIGDFWEFGNGDTSLIKSPIFTYSSAGKYTVKLTGISSKNACPSTFQSVIEVLAQPTTAIEIDTSAGCEPFSLEFRQQSSLSSIFFNWDFGDGNSGIGSTVPHQYAKAGTYEAKLVSKDQFGCISDSMKALIRVFPKPPADFVLTKDKPCGLPATVFVQHNHQEKPAYLWNFGNNQQSTATLPQAIYSDTGLFQVKLVSTNEFNCVAQSVQNIHIYQRPLAAFELDQLTFCTGNELPLTNTSMYADQYRWTFGNGIMSTERDPIFRYSLPGNYRLQLWVSNASGCKDSFSLARPLQILPSPVADFTYEEIPFENRPSGVVQFKESARNASSFNWDFGDGNTSILTNPSHRFSSNGDKQVTLEVTAANQCKHDTTKTITLGFFGGLYVPNTMAPDHALNDARYFWPKGSGLKSYHLQIFSGLGDLVWETTALTPEGLTQEGWDGTKDGNPLPQDIYVWKISAVFLNNTSWIGQRQKNGKYKTSGTFLIMR